MPAYKELSSINLSVIHRVIPLFNGLMNQDEFQKLDCSGLENHSSEGMAVFRKATAEKWRKNWYSTCRRLGLTENFSVASCNPIDRNRTMGYYWMFHCLILKMITCGWCRQLFCQMGETWLRSHSKVRKSWRVTGNRPPDTAEVMMGDGLSTGDIGLIEW